MRFLKWLDVGLATAVLLFVVIGLCLPQRFPVERGVFINFPPESVHAVVNLKKKVEAANTMAAKVDPLGGAKPADERPAEDRK